ncbi:MAG: ANTAR domain-containing protein, partial [Chloroflexota bacterium]
MAVDYDALWRVLVLEPDDDLAQLLAAILVGEGCVVRCVPTPAEMAAEARLWQPHLLMIDLPPPHWPVEGLMDALGAIGAGRLVPLLLLLDARTPTIGCYGPGRIITKPFDIDDL